MTKKECQDKLKEMLSRAKINMPFQQGSPEYDFALYITAGLPIVYSERRDPEAYIAFTVLEMSNRHSKKPYRCLHVYNTKSEKWLPLPATKLFRAKSPTVSSKKQRVLSALRLIVKPQIEDFKTCLTLPQTCPLTFKELSSKDGRLVHVDHFTTPFIRIVEEWLILHQLTFELISLDRSGNIKNPEVARDFYLYHKKRADLRLVDKSANLRKGAKTPTEAQSFEIFKKTNK